MGFPFLSKLARLACRRVPSARLLALPWVSTALYSWLKKKNFVLLAINVVGDKKGPPIV